MKRFLQFVLVCLGLFSLTTVGYAGPIKKSLKAVPPASITPSAPALAALSTTYGTVSGETSFSFTASNLTASEVVTVTPPAGFEVSLTTSVGFAGSVTATADGTGAISSTNIFVRLKANASVAGSPYSGNITLVCVSTSANKATVSSTVNPKALTMSGLSVPASKIYDGTTSAVVSGTPSLQSTEAIGVGNSADGKPYTADAVSITGTAIGTYDSKDVASATTVVYSGLSLTGTGFTNYTLTIQANSPATITKKALTMTGLSVPASKIYDGTTSAVVSGGPGNLLSTEAAGAGTTADGKPYTGNGDAVSITGTAVGTYNSKDVSAATTVVYSGLSLTGTGNNNYTLTIQSNDPATITPKALTLTGSTLSVPASKIYDGTTSAVVSGSPGALQSTEATGTGTTADGKPYSVDAVSTTGSATGTYNSKDVATATTVTYGGLSLTGAGNTNYTVTMQASDPATITTKALTMSGLSVPASKIYDATTAAVVSGSPSLATAESTGSGNTADGKPYTGNGDAVSITGTAIGTYNFKDVATATTVNYSGLTLTGAGNTNYTLTIQSAASATITKKNLTINGVSAINKPYDGTTTATLSGAPALLTAEAAGAGSTADGKPYTGDAVTPFSGPTSVNFATAATSAGQAGIAVNVVGYAFTGAQAGNYTPVQPVGLTANIYAQEPTAQARNITFGSVTASSFTINWAAPGGSPAVPGTNYLVVINPGGTGSIGATVPADLTDYTASSDLSSPGSQITANNYVVYNGTGTSVALTNLNPNTGYEVKVFLFNGSPTSGLENYLTSVAGANNPKTQTTNNFDNTSTFTAGTGSATIASTVNTVGAEVVVFQFTANDLGPDNISTRFTQLTFKQGGGNQVADWTQLILGAELFDSQPEGGTYPGTGPHAGYHDLASITPTTIVIPNISAGNPPDLGTVAEASSKNYFLKIYLKPSLGGSLPTTIDNLHLEFSVTGSDIVPVAGHSVFAPASTTSSGSANDKVTVTASKLTFVQEPAAAVNAFVPLSPQPKLSATDANNNLDLDPISASVTAGALSPNSPPSGFTMGFMDFGTANTYNYQSTGSSTMTVTTTSTPVGLTKTSAVTTVVTASTTLGASATTMSTSPLLNSTVGVISGGSATNAVLGFSLVTTGSPLTLSQLVFTSSVSITGLVQNFSLYSSPTDNFAGATLVTTSPSLTFSGLSVPLSGTAKYFFLVCDVDAFFPSLNPTISFSLPAGNFTVSGGSKLGSTQTGITYTLNDITPPTVQSITIIPPPTTNVWSTTNGTSASTVTYRVTFSEPVSGISYSGGNKNFTPVTSGSVVAPNPSGATTASNFVDITIAGITGQGLVRVDFSEKDNIVDNGNNPVGGVGIGNGNLSTTFTGNQFYSIVLPQPAVEATTLNTTTITSNSVTLTWNGGVTLPLASNFLVLAQPTTGGSFPTLEDVVAAPGSHHFISNGALVQNVTRIAGTNTYTFNGLQSGTSYDFRVYRYSLSSNYSNDNIDYETTTFGAVTAVTNTAATSWMALNSTAVPISSIMDNNGNSASVMSFKIYDDGLDPISPNVMTLFDNGTSPEIVTFTLRDQLTLPNGSSVTGFTSSTGAVASAIYTSTTNTITLTSGANGQWTGATTISYSAITGNAQFVTLGKMQSITAHVLAGLDQVVPYSSPGVSTFTVPAGVTSIQVEAWGAGGSAGGYDSYYGGASQGGGGGGYSSSVIPVIPGASYNVTVGAGGAAVTTVTTNLTCCISGNSGQQSIFGPSLVVANGGLGGQSAAYYSFDGTSFVSGLGLGGAPGIGTTTFSGGNGGNGGGNNTGTGWLAFMPNNLGGSGGSSAGTSANGNNGSGGFTGACPSCFWGNTIAPAGGGAGGSGREGSSGTNGVFPGGGGGGSDVAVNAAGANGQVIVSYSSPTGTSDWAGDNSPFKFSQIVFTQGPANSGALSNWQNIIAGAELTDGTSTVSGTINSANITFAAIPSSVATDVGFVPDATVSPSSKTYTLKVWLKNNLSNALAASVDGLNLDFKLDTTIPANLTYDDVTNSAQKSSRLATPSPSFNSGASQIQVVASQLVYNTAGNAPTNTNPQSQIGVGVPFSANVPGQDPEVYALDANNNLDLGYNNSANITNTLSYGQSIASASFSSGKLSLNPLLFNTGSVTVANTQIVVTGTGVPTVTAATSTNIWPVISSLTTISQGAAAPASELASFPSTTNSLPAAFNFDFAVTDDVGADGVAFTNNDALPTIIKTVTITQDSNNGINGGGDVTTFDDWTKTIAGAQLFDVNTSTGVNAVSINAASLVFNLPAAMQTVPDGGSQTYQLRIWLKNPVDPTLVDILDNKDFAFAINDTNLSPLGAANTTSQMTASSTNTGDGRNVVTVTASELDFVTQWLPAANQYYDAPLDADAVTVGVQSPAGKARDANGNLDLDFNAAVTVATQSPALLPVANATVGVSNGLLSFDPLLQVTSAGGGADLATPHLVLKSGALSGSSNDFTLNYSHNSDIVQDNSFSYSSNILYASANNQQPNPLTNTTGIALEQFLIRDGGASHSDPDGSPTILNSITLDVDNYLNLRELALFNGVTNLKEVSVIPANYTVFGGKARITFSGFTFTAAKNTDAPLTIKGSFNANGVTDNQVISFTVVSVSASLTGSSQFANTSPVGIQSNVSGNKNKIEVVATQIVYTTLPPGPAASLNVPFAVTVQAQDAFLNLDADYNGTISAFTTSPGGPTFVTANNPSGAFVSGSLNFPGTFQFTTGNGSTTLVLNSGPANTVGASVDAGAIAGTSVPISVITSFDSWLYFDPTFTYTDQIDFVPFQNGTTSATSQALASVILSDGGAPGSVVSVGNPSPGTKNPLVSHSDIDGASTQITDFTISLTNFGDIKTIGLFTVGGVKIGSDQTPAATVTFSGLSGFPAPDDGSIAYVIRAEFNSTIVDQHQITMKITAATQNSGSNFPTNGTIAGVAGGDAPSGGHNFLNVIATSLDFTTQPSNFAGINEPIGIDPSTTQPYSYGNPASLTLMPTTTPGIVTARDKFANTDTGFGPPSIAIADAANNSISSPATFVSGVLNLNGMEYGSPGNGKLTVTAGGVNSTTQINTTGTITSSTGSSTVTGVGTKFLTDLTVGSHINDPSGNPIGIVSSVASNTSLTLTGNASIGLTSSSYNANSIPCRSVNVLHVSVTQDLNGVVPGSNVPPVASLKGGLASQNIFGLKFTAVSASGVDPKLKGFTIGFKGNNGQNLAYETNGTVIFKNFNVYINGAVNNITSIGGQLTKVNTSATLGSYDQIFVDLSAQPQSLSSGPISFFLVADVDASTNSGTPSITPYFKDEGWGFATDQNTIVSNGTAVGAFDGNQYSFASTKPPVLKADLKLFPSTKTSPYAGQPNVDPAISKITLEFDTNVGSLDLGGTKSAELWSRSSNTKVADLALDTTTPVSPVAAPVTPQQKAIVSAQNTASNVYPTLLFDIVNKPALLTPDEVYFVKLVKGSYDPNTQVGQGISDYGLNFYGGISDNSTLYFKISSNKPIKLTGAQSTFNTTTVGSLTTNFDQLGTAYFLIVKSGDPAPSISELIGSTSYVSAHPSATVAAPTNYAIGTPGNYQITGVNANQTYTFPATFVAGQSYDVYIFAQNDAVPTPVPALGIYGPSPFTPQTTGPILPALTISGIAGTQSSFTPNNVPPNNLLLYALCPDSYVTITNPMVIGEKSVAGTVTSSFSFNGDQDFNILLPTGYQYDITVSPNVQLIGSNFNNLNSRLYANTGSHPTWEYKYISNTLLNIRFNNYNGIQPDTQDDIAISGVSIIGKSGSGQGNIEWFYGSNVFTMASNPIFSLAQVALLANSSPDFNNSFWSQNQPFPAPNSPVIIAAFNKTVNAIPDNYNDPNNPGSIRLLPIASTFASGDYLASFFSGTGVSGDLLTLNAVTTGAAFNITMNHTDLNGCATAKSEQYVVYDHNSPISKKLGVTLNSTSPISPAGTKQDIVNTKFPTGAANPIVSPTLGPSELAGYTLFRLSVDLPASSQQANSTPMSGPAWRNVIHNTIIDSTNAPTYKWDYSKILNAVNPVIPSTFTNGVYDYFKTPTLSTNQNLYWLGGSLGNIEFTGTYQSTADNTVYVPFRQDVELFIPAVPLIEAINPKPVFDKTDPATTPNFNNVQYPNGYPGTSTFCEAGGTISISGYPLALAGTSTGTFAIYDFKSYTIGGTNTPLMAPNPNSAFVDNGNGTMTLDPTNAVIQNGYSDVLVTYTYQDNSSPAIGTGYLVIRVTPNPVARFTIASTAANPGPSAFDAFCSNSQIKFNASGAGISTLAASSQGYPNSIVLYSWDFGDPNSTSNSASGPSASSPSHTYAASSIYTVNLTLTSQWGCQSLPFTDNSPATRTITSDVLYSGSSGSIKVGDIPTPSYNFLGNCATDLISFDGTNSSMPLGSNSQIAVYNWTFDSLSVKGIANHPVPGVATGSTASTKYKVAGNYSTKLTVITNVAGAHGCQKSVSNNLVQLPLYSPTSTNSYLEYFGKPTNGDGGWIALDLVNGGSGSWAWGKTSGKNNPNFNTSSIPDSLWATSLSGTYAPNEQSALYSACFNLANLPRPMLSYSSFVDLLSGEGLVVQFSVDSKNITDPTKIWTVLGSYSNGLTDGLDWYNASALTTAPGGIASNTSEIGWSNSSTQWIQPKHALDTVETLANLANSINPRAVLRFAFSSGNSSATATLDGIGIDNVRIGSRTRTIMFENFTTTDGGNSTVNGQPINTVLSKEASDIVNFNSKNVGTQLVNINYHVGFLGPDPFNLDNPADPSARALYYNIQKVPYAFLDGVHSPQYSLSGTSDLFGDWGQRAYNLQTLKLAKADFSATAPPVNNPNDRSMEVDVNFTPVVDLPAGTILQVAFVEENVSKTSLAATPPIGTSETQFEYVLKKMLPSAAGTKFTKALPHNVPVSAGKFKWIPEKLYSDKLAVILFLQDEGSREVYQAELFAHLTPPPPITGIEPITAEDIKIYPNPADQEFTLELPAPAQQNMKLTMANQLGQFTEMGSISEGEQSKKVSTQGLAEGVYILQLGSNGNALRTKVVVLHK